MLWSALKPPSQGSFFLLGSRSDAGGFCCRNTDGRESCDVSGKVKRLSATPAEGFQHREKAGDPKKRHGRGRGYKRRAHSHAGTTVPSSAPLENPCWRGWGGRAGVLVAPQPGSLLLQTQRAPSSQVHGAGGERCPQLTPAMQSVAFKQRKAYEKSIKIQKPPEASCRAQGTGQSL